MLLKVKELFYPVVARRSHDNPDSVVCQASFTRRYHSTEGGDIILSARFNVIFRQRNTIFD